MQPDNAPKETSPGPDPQEWTLVPPVLVDTAITKFGEVLQQPKNISRIGLNTISTVFVCAHPRNGGKFDDITGTEKFVSIEYFEKQTENIKGKGGKVKEEKHRSSKNMEGIWKEVITDGYWDVRYLWKRVRLTESICRVEWDAGRTVKIKPGLYRIKIHGHYKQFLWKKELSLLHYFLNNKVLRLKFFTKI